MSLIQVSSLNNVKTYDLAGGARLPQFVADRAKGKSKKGLHARAGAQGSTRHVEVLQDLDFPGACQRVRFSADGEYFMATGCYPPQLRIYELRQLSMKVKRHVDAELVQFQILSDDYRKVAMLRTDRTLELHAQYGVHFKTRIPSFGRDLQYEPATCDLLCAGAGPEVWSLNLDEGRFREPLLTGCPAVNVLARSAAHGMIAVGGEDGAIECLDPRSRARLGMVDAAARLPPSALGGGAADGGSGGGQRGVSGVTALAFEEGGLLLGAGLAGGHVVLYDIRMPRPLLQKDHQYGLPLKSIAFARAAAAASEAVVVSADSKAVRIWRREDGRSVTTIEPPADINELALCPRSGLLLLGLEQPNLGVHFVPALGPAPRWCAFLDSLTEELEEDQQASGGGGELYDDYRFVTRDELERLGLGSLVGTNLLRAYMHGFFVDAGLHAKAVALAQPFAYEEWRQQRIQQKARRGAGRRGSHRARAGSRAHARSGPSCASAAAPAFCPLPTPGPRWRRRLWAASRPCARRRPRWRRPPSTPSSPPSSAPARASRTARRSARLPERARRRSSPTRALAGSSPIRTLRSTRRRWSTRSCTAGPGSARAAGASRRARSPSGWRRRTILGMTTTARAPVVAATTRAATRPTARARAWTTRPAALLAAAPHPPSRPSASAASSGLRAG